MGRHPKRTAQAAAAFLAVLCSTGVTSAADAQSPSEATCLVTGLVTSAAIPLPGVTVRLQSDGRPLITTSTDRDGRWHTPVGTGRHQVLFVLRGFTPEARTVDIDPASCHNTPPIVELDVTRSTLVTTTDSLAPTPASVAPLPRRIGRATVVRGRDATLNRAALRNRESALARGDIVLGSPLVRDVPSIDASRSPADAAAPTPLSARASGLTLGALPLAAPARAPRLPTIPSQRLFSATASYTVAGSALDATPYQLRADTRLPKPDYFRNSVDFTVGGPLALLGNRGASRTNATLSYSAIRGGNLFDQYATVPTAEMRAGNFSALGTTILDPVSGAPFADGVIPRDRIDPTAAQLLAFLPLPTAPGASRNFHVTSTNASTQDRFDLRLTQPLTGTNQESASTRRGSRTSGGPAQSAMLNGQVEFRRNVNDRLSAIPAVAGVSRTSNLRIPVSLNVTRRGTQHAAAISYARNDSTTRNLYAGTRDVAASSGVRGASADPFAWGLPNLSFATLTNLTDLQPTERRDERVAFSYAWSRSIRTHRVRTGIDYGHSTSRSRSDANARGSFVFTGLYSGSDLADFLLGYPQQASLQYGPGTVHLSGDTLSLFAQDDWRRWSRVTINAGLRYELVTPYRESYGRLANLDVAPGFTAVTPVLPGQSGPYSGGFPDTLISTDTNNLAPRAGLAWRVASRTTLRLGYGVSFNTGSYSGLARQLSSQPPFAVTNTVSGSPTQPLSLSSALLADATSSSHTFGVDRNYEAGRVATWTLDLARDMGDAWNVSTGLVLANGTSLDIVRAPNRGPDGLRLVSVQPFLWQTSEGRSSLRSASVRVRRWYVRGMSLSANYTLATSSDNASTLGGGTTMVAQDEQNLDAEWGPSSFNRRHRISGDLNFELPFGGDHRWLNRGGLWATLLGQWSVYVTYGVQSGTPLTARVLSNSRDVARGINGTLRADQTGLSSSLPHPTVDQFFNTAAFRVPAAGAFGSAGRNSLVGPGNRELSLQLTRDVAVASRTLSVQLRASNVLNLVNYGTVDTVVNSPTFGQVLSVRPLRSVQINVRWKL